MTLKLDLVQTLAFGGIVLMLGYGLRRFVPWFARVNLPAPVLGGLTIALLMLFMHDSPQPLLVFDTTLQTPLMVAFFATVGFNASFALLRVGGPQVLLFFAICAGFALLQNVVGVAVALLFGLDPLFGILAGSVTLTGGPATGIAFAPLFESAGVTGAASVAVAVAMAGIVAGGLIGSPVATWLIERRGVRTPGTSGQQPVEVTTTAMVEEAPRLVASPVVEDEDAVAFEVLKNVVALLVALWLGNYLSQAITALGITLPLYIGAMIVATAMRNLDDLTGWLGLSPRILDTIGAVALSLFLVLALMTLRLWELSGLAAPLVVTLLAQVALIVVVAGGVFRLMGRDYEAAVMTGGFIGFMLGTTANAMAVMRSLTERYGIAPRAFLVAPLVGAFFIDFANLLLITVSINLVR
jgi:ESS family glutamate:Na+ symporter